MTEQPFHNCWLCRALLGVLVWLSALGGRLAAQENPSGAEPMASLSVSVTDDQGQPLERAEVSILKWTGEFKPYPQAQISRKDGRFLVSNLSTEDMCYLKVVCDGYAPSMQSLLGLTANETREIRFKVASPVHGWVSIVSPERKPIQGAEISRLQFTDANDNEVYLTPKTARALGFDFAPSDQQGRLFLPSLPRGARCEVTVVHPDWCAGKLTLPEIKPDSMGELQLAAGVRVRIELAKPDGDRSNLEGQMLTVNMHTDARATSEPVSLIHTFPISDNKVSFTAYPIEYRSLSVALDSHFSHPNMLNLAVDPDTSLDLRAVTDTLLHFKIKPKVKGYGKVVDSRGVGIKDVSVISSFSADPNANWNERSEGATRVELARRWSSGGSAETNADGNYEIELAQGKTVIEVIKHGYFFEPVVLELDVAGEGISIPDIILFPVPELHGKVVASHGEAVSNAYVRMRHTGYGDADPCCESAADGTFVLKPLRIPYSSTAGLQSVVSVVALDAATGQGGITEIDLTDAEAVKDIRVELAPRPSDWLLNVVKDNWTGDERTQGAREGQLAEARLQFPAGVEGQPVPTMSEGTWLNTEANSLKAFAGKTILLDFWFIGCGPCLRDMPSVKMAHRQYSKLGFTVVSVHDKSAQPEDVAKFAKANGMDYPIVVDDSAGTILNQYRALGVASFPSYILLDGEGRILRNDRTSSGATLRMYKLERIYEALRQSGDPLTSRKP